MCASAESSLSSKSVRRDARVPIGRVESLSHPTSSHYMLASLPWHGPPPRLVHETKGLLFVDKPAGLSFHASEEFGDPGIFPLLRAMCANGDIAYDGRLYSVHRLDRVTSGLLMVAKTAEAAAEAGELLREHRLQKYYCALSGRKPSKKMGKVRGDMERSRRGQWKLLRSMNRPATTAFISEALVHEEEDPRTVAEASAAASSSSAARRAFVLKPLTGRTHQLRVALKSLGSPVLGDPMYAAATAAANEQRAYLHAAALRIPAGRPALSEDGAPVDVICPPTEGAAFQSAAFQRWWQKWFAAQEEGAAWWEGTPVASPGWADR